MVNKIDWSHSSWGLQCIRNYKSGSGKCHILWQMLWDGTQGRRSTAILNLQVGDHLPEVVTSKLKSGRETGVTKSLSVIIFFDEGSSTVEEKQGTKCVPCREKSCKWQNPRRVIRKAEAAEYKTGIGSFLFRQTWRHFTYLSYLISSAAFNSAISYKHTQRKDKKLSFQKNYKRFERNNPSKIAGSDRGKEVAIGRRQLKCHRKAKGPPWWPPKAQGIILYYSKWYPWWFRVKKKKNKLHVVYCLQNRAKRTFKTYLYPKWF